MKYRRYPPIASVKPAGDIPIPLQSKNVLDVVTVCVSVDIAVVIVPCAALVGLSGGGQDGSRSLASARVSVNGRLDGSSLTGITLGQLFETILNGAGDGDSEGLVDLEVENHVDHSIGNVVVTQNGLQTVVSGGLCLDSSSVLVWFPAGSNVCPCKESKY